jgi:hypothetical protein
MLSPSLHRACVLSMRSCEDISRSRFVKAIPNRNAGTGVREASQISLSSRSNPLAKAVRNEGSDKSYY